MRESTADPKRKGRSRRTGSGRGQNAPPRSTAWRTLPATDRQLATLRRVTTVTGRTHPAELSRGEASDLIDARRREDPAAARRLDRSERRRRRIDAQLVNPAASWRFGDKQTAEQEAAEIRRARSSGLESVYCELQRWVLARRGAP